MERHAATVIGMLASAKGLVTQRDVPWLGATPDWNRSPWTRRSDGSFYVGHTDDLEARLAAHRKRLYCGYTAKRLPVRLVFSDSFATREEAFDAERQIKGWSRAKKLALSQGDWVEVQRLALCRSPQPEGYRRTSARGSRTSP